MTVSTSSEAKAPEAARHSAQAARPCLHAREASRLRWRASALASGHEHGQEPLASTR